MCAGITPETIYESATYLSRLAPIASIYYTTYTPLINMTKVKKSLQIDLIFPGSSAVTPAEVEIICEKKIEGMELC